MESFGFTEDQIVSVSAKTMENVDYLLDVIVDRTPAPQGDPQAPLRGLVMTSHYDFHKGVIASVRVLDGMLTKQKLRLISTQTDFAPIELEIFLPLCNLGR